MRVGERGRWVTSYELAMKGYSAGKLVKMFGGDRVFISYSDDTAWIPEDIGMVIFGGEYISTMSSTMELGGDDYSCTPWIRSPIVYEEKRGKVEEVNVKRRIVLEEG